MVGDSLARDVDGAIAESGGVVVGSLIAVWDSQRRSQHVRQVGTPVPCTSADQSSRGPELA